MVGIWTCRDSKVEGHSVVQLMREGAHHVRQGWTCRDSKVEGMSELQRTAPVVWNPAHPARDSITGDATPPSRAPCMCKHSHQPLEKSYGTLLLFMTPKTGGAGPQETGLCKDACPLVGPQCAAVLRGPARVHKACNTQTHVG